MNMITLRQMVMEDAYKMFKWKNYPETRQFALVSHNEIQYDDHIRWLENNLQYFQVIILDRQVVGAVRVQDKEVSIWVDRAFWGRGIAVEAIREVSKPGFTARIVTGNIASRKAFVKAGYLPIIFSSEYIVYKYD